MEQQCSLTDKARGLLHIRLEELPGCHGIGLSDGRLVQFGNVHRRNTADFQGPFPKRSFHHESEHGR